MTPKSLALSLALVLGLAGCSQPLHMQYDHGRAYAAALQAQADLTRPTVADAGYPLNGVEGLEIRQRVIEESTDAESGTAEYTQTFTAQ